MIVVGYQGIGKSTLAQYSYRRIDLESSNFWYEEKRPDDWYVYYCQIAIDLSKQGYTVFVSSHQAVRDFLLEHTTELVFVIYPSLQLKEDWIKKLEARFFATHTEKDRKAWRRAEQNYEDNIKEISDEIYFQNPYFKMTQIDDIEYKLDDIITEAEQYNREYKSL